MLRLRNYDPDRDFAEIASWFSDERTHAMWCANRFSYPLKQEDFESTLRMMSENSGDIPLTAVDERDDAVGFLCYASPENGRTGLIKFVAVDKDRRGQGFGKQLIKKAVRYVLEESGAEKLRLHVFSENTAAICCYTACGFRIVSEVKSAFPYREEQWGRITMEKELYEKTARIDDAPGLYGAF